MKKIAILASGSGTNAKNIAEFFNNNPEIEVNCILSNKKDAYVLERAKKLGIHSMWFNRHDFYNTNNIIKTLIDKKIDLIVLAGFLWLIPDEFLKSFPDRIINIHPALLPKYGGKGMYGMNVHRSVIENREKKSGISIHIVNEKYDEGLIIFQAEVDIEPFDTPEMLAEKIHSLEYIWYPKIIEKVITEIS